MAIVYVTNKKTGKKYAYESVSVWNPELKQPRAKRKYLGVVDEETGEIIPSSKKRGRKPNPDKNTAENEEKASGRRTYKKMNKQLKAANRKLTSKINRIESILNNDD